MNLDTMQRRRTPRRHESPHAVGEALEGRRLLAASLLTDVNTGPIGSEPAAFVEFKGAVYFAAEGPQGRELYRSDGTPGSAALVADLNPGYVGSNPSHLTVVGDTLHFVAGVWTGGAGGEGRELWKTDGTAAGTVRVKDIVPGLAGSNPEQLEAIGGRLFFVARDAQERESVWRSDGTEAGTLPVATPATGEFNILEYEFAGDSLYFLTAAYTTGPGLWASDGGSPPRLVAALPYIPFNPPTPPRGLTALGDRVVFVSGDGNQYNWPVLWTSDGTTAGTRMVPANERLFARSPLAVVGGWAYFFSGGLSGNEDLLRTDGESLEFVATVRQGRGGGVPGPMVVRRDGTIFFQAHDAEGSALWRSGGGQPTRALAPVPAESLTLSSDTLYFGSDGALWKSDGTEAGTVKIRDFVEHYDSGPKEIAPFRNGVVFQADDVPSPGAGYEARGEPWFSDGTAAGTYALGDVNPATLGSGTHYPPPPSHSGPVTINGRVLFGAREADGGVGLWTSDGTTAGTTAVASLNAGTLFALVAVSDGLALALVGDGGYAEVWRSDGTAAGTRLVAPVWVNSACDCNRLDSVAVLNGEMYFSGSPRPDNEGTGYVGKELMKSDGTPQGTVVVKDIAPANPDWNPGSYPTDLTTVGGQLYFTTNGWESRVPGMPNELWRTDGSEAGTVKVMDFDGGAAGATNARDLFNAGGTLYFRTDAPVGEAWEDPASEQLWKSDGTAEGTEMLAQFPWASLDEWRSDYPGSERPGMAFVNGTVYFPAATAASADDVELWKTDGTPAGTVLLRDINPGAAASLPATLTPFGGRVFFSAADGAGGRELWSSDGTTAGTARVTDLNPGRASSDPVVWAEIDGRLYFTADDGAHGQELWSTDGTDAGTVLVHDVRPGPDRPFEPAPQSPVGVGGPGGRRVVYWADDRLHGMEPWVAILPRPDNSFVVGRHVFYNNSRYDGRNPAANRGDDAAIAPDKRALRPGEAASFRNVTGYSRGINGVMVDVNTRLAFYDDLRFSFKVGNDDSPGDWAPAPAPASLSRRNNGLPLDLDRWTVTWADGAIRNAWLEVTVEAVLDGRIVAADVFYFGNSPGETGDAPPAGSGAVAVVSPTDFGRTRDGVHTRVATLANPFDHNRDGVVNVLDLNAVRGNMTARLFPPTVTAAGLSLEFQRGLLFKRDGERFARRRALDLAEPRVG